MASDIVLQVEQLSKCFKIYANPWDRAREWATFGKRTYHQPFWALQDISFEVERGEFFGIIGQNGAGKSTLLKILSGVLQPTGGTYQVKGRVLSMLELGMDFNPYLTGWENVLRSTELLGFPDGYVQSRMAQIAEFSELGDFFDRPVRLYSTGMAARLAFSMYAFLECDVLILDEVLAVGDLFFRQKCYARLEELIAKQTTIIFVTHAMDAVREYCQQVILLHKGHMLYQGAAQEAIRRYYQVPHRDPASLKFLQAVEKIPGDNADVVNTAIPWPAGEVLTPGPAANGQPAHLTRFAICNHRGEPAVDFEQGDVLTFYGEFQINAPLGVPNIRLDVTNQFNALIHSKNLTQSQIALPQGVRPGTVLRVVRTLTLALQTGEYVAGVQMTVLTPADYARLDELAAQEDFWRRHVIVCQYPQLSYFKVHRKGAQSTHTGVCDLPGTYHLEVIPPPC
jgi:lipopolysaccharide transport system ATP-binding protein